MKTVKELREDPRLNPFAFSAETNGRFILLMLAALSGIFMLSVQVGSTGRHLLAAAVAGDEEQTAVQLLTFELLSPLTLMILTLGIAWAFYYFYPQWFIWQKGAQEIKLNQMCMLDNFVQQVADEHNFREPICVSIGQDVLDEGKAFGRKNQPFLLLFGSPDAYDKQWLLKSRQRKLQALWLHELGHIANDDTHRTSQAFALWLISSIYALLAFLFLLSSGLVPWRQLLTLTVFPILLTLIWGSIQQIREYYADWFAIMWGMESGLDEAWQKHLHKKAKGEPKQSWQLWLRKLRYKTMFHPSYKSSIRDDN